MRVKFRVTTIQILFACTLILIFVVVATRFFSQLPQQRHVTDAEALAAVVRNPIKAYTAEYEERVTGSASKKSMLTRRIVEAVRAGGDKAIKTTYFGPKGYLTTERKLLLGSKKVSVSIVDDTKTLVAEHSGVWNPTSPFRLDPSFGCKANFKGIETLESSGPDEDLLGFRAVRVRPISKAVAATLPNGEMWLVPDLQCLQFKQIVSTLDSKGNATDTSELKVISFKLGEQAPELFEIPKTYSSVPPSEAAKRKASFLKLPAIPTGEQALLKQADAKYFADPVDVSKIK